MEQGTHNRSTVNVTHMQYCTCGLQSVGRTIAHTTRWRGDGYHSVTLPRPNKWKKDVLSQHARKPVSEAARKTQRARNPHVRSFTNRHNVGVCCVSTCFLHGCQREHQPWRHWPCTSGVRASNQNLIGPHTMMVVGGGWKLSTPFRVVGKRYCVTFKMCIGQCRTGWEL